MIIAKHPNKTFFVFSEWSRKGYAVFASLNRIVNVAQLPIDITQITGNKQLFPIQYLEEDIFEDTNNDRDSIIAFHYHSEFNVVYTDVNSDINSTRLIE